MSKRASLQRQHSAPSLPLARPTPAHSAPMTNLQLQRQTPYTKTIAAGSDPFVVQRRGGSRSAGATPEPGAAPATPTLKKVVRFASPSEQPSKSASIRDGNAARMLVAAPHRAGSPESNAMQPDHADQASVLRFVSDALAKRIEGDSILYNALVDTISKKPGDQGALSPQHMANYLRAFTLNVSHLSAKAQSLIMAVLSVEWLSTSDTSKLAKNYCMFIENLVSAHAIYLAPVSKMLIQRLVDAGRQCSKADSDAAAIQLHSVLERILRLVPTGPSFLLPILTVNFPHKSESADIQVFYVRNLLKMIDYAPVLQNQILALIVEGIVQIDSDIQMGVEELDEDQLEALQETVFSMDDLEVDSANENARDQAASAADDGAQSNNTQGSSSASDGEAAGRQQHRNGDEDSSKNHDSGVDNVDYDSDAESLCSDAVNDFVPITSDIKATLAKLDALLGLVLQYVTDVHASDMQGDNGVHPKLPGVFSALLDIFDRIVLPTHRLRCTQFLVFYASSLDPNFPEELMGLLVSRLFSVTSPSSIRVSAAAYLGSFIARARFVDLGSVRMCLRLLNQFVLGYIEMNEPNAGNNSASTGSGIPSVVASSASATSIMPSVERYTVFYSAVQAILYVYCFRWRQLMMVDDVPMTGQFPSELKGFQRVLLSRFSPLRVCSEAIVEEFAKIMHMLDILYCYPLMSSMPMSSAMAAVVAMRPSAQRAAVAAAANSGGILPSISGLMMDATMSKSAASGGHSRTSTSSSTTASTSVAPDMMRTSSQSSIASSALMTQVGSTPEISHASVLDRLEAFFPFDPLALPRSRTYVHDMYQEWEGTGAESDQDPDDGCASVSSSADISGFCDVTIDPDASACVVGSFDGSSFTTGSYMSSMGSDGQGDMASKGHLGDNASSDVTAMLISPVLMPSKQPYKIHRHHHATYHGQSTDMDSDDELRLPDQSGFELMSTSVA